MKRHVWLWLLLAASVVAVWVYMRSWPEAPYTSPDSQGYMKVARDLAGGGLDQPRVRTPGYPILLLLTGASTEPTRSLFIVQLLLQIASVILVCVTLRSVGAGDGLVLTSGVIGLLPPFVQNAGYLLSETLAQFCIVLGVAALQRFLEREGRAWLLAASVAFGYAALTRPTFQLAALVLGALLLLLTRRTGSRVFRVRDAFVLLIGTLVLVGGWALYNESRFGVPGTISTLGFNLANRCPDLYEEIPDPVTRRIFVEARNEAYVSGKAVPWAHFAAQPRLMSELGMRSKAEIEPWIRKQMTRAILGHPVRYAEIVAGSLARFWFPVTGSLPLLRERPLRRVWYAVHFLLISLLAAEVMAFGSWILVTLAGIRSDDQTRRAWTLWSICALVVLYNALISCMLETGETRYRTSTELLLLLAGGAGIVAARGLFRVLAAAAKRIATRAQGV